VEDVLYNGKLIKWHGKGEFKATSGMPGFQIPKKQCVVEKGPVPEGTYYIPLIEGSLAEDDGTGICQLKPSWQLQEIPRGAAAGKCEPYWANWGNNRVRFEPNDIITKQKCSPVMRDGFYLHDSVKGFSHGCIEVENRFFIQLRFFVKYSKQKKLILKIQYKSGRLQMVVLKYKLSSFFLFGSIFATGACIAGQEYSIDVDIDNSLHSCIEMSESGIIEDDQNVFLDTLWVNKLPIGDCGCKSAAMSYSVKLADGDKLVSYGVISSFDKRGYKFLINHDSSINYKSRFKLSIGCSA